MTPRETGVESWPVLVVQEGARQEIPDAVVVEEPLEIALLAGAKGDAAPLTVTMRTPGEDLELAAGLLYGEGWIETRDDLLELREERRRDRPLENRVVVRLREELAIDPARLARTLASSSACGVCGKATIDAVLVTGFPALARDAPRVSRAVLAGLSERLRPRQDRFARTGGLHAAALFDAQGNLLGLREDVGRHNAVDKLLGAWLLEGRLPAREAILLVSGRAGFEIAQKALRAGVPILAAVGAPSSLTLRLAERAGMTVVGFLRDERFNLYTSPERIAD